MPECSSSTKEDSQEPDQANPSSQSLNATPKRDVSPLPESRSTPDLCTDISDLSDVDNILAKETPERCIHAERVKIPTEYEYVDDLDESWGSDSIYSDESDVETFMERKSEIVKGIKDTLKSNSAVVMYPGMSSKGKWVEGQVVMKEGELCVHILFNLMDLACIDDSGIQYVMACITLVQENKNEMFCFKGNRCTEAGVEYIPVESGEECLYESRKVRSIENPIEFAADENGFEKDPLLNKWMNLAKQLYRHQVLTQNHMLNSFNFNPEQCDVAFHTKRTLKLINAMKTKRKRGRSMKVILESDDGEDMDDRDDRDDRDAKRVRPSV